MKRREVVVGPRALAHLEDLYDWIAEAATPAVAETYLDRVLDFLDRLDLASERGTLRAELRPGLRIVGFERHLNIAFEVVGDQV